VQFVKVPEEGVPRTGVVNVGLVANTLFPVPVFVTLTKFFEASVATAEEAVKPESNKLPTDSLVPSKVMFAEPANTPELLY
jgi:hypothetical protein